MVLCHSVQSVNCVRVTERMDKCSVYNVDVVSIHVDNLCLSIGSYI